MASSGSGGSPVSVNAAISHFAGLAAGAHGAAADAAVAARGQAHKAFGVVEGGLEAGETLLGDKLDDTRGLILSQLDAVEDTSPLGAIVAFSGLALENDTPGNRMKLVPGLGRKILIDDDDAILVLVLPKLEDHGDEDGAYDSKDEVESGWSTSDEDEDLLKNVCNPTEQAAQLFHGEEVTRGSQCVLDLPEVMSVAAYQRAVRRKLAYVIKDISNMKLTCFESIDEDVVFWKISADAVVLKDIAEKCLYKMPYAESAYSSVDMHLPKVGEAIFAFATFSRHTEDEFQTFRGVDAIRLVYQQLQSHTNLKALEVQGVIDRWFPAANYEDMMELHMQWVRWKCPNFFEFLPRDGDVDKIRTYFGEEIAFFFRFYVFYIYNLRVLALAGFIIAMLHTRLWGHIHLSNTQLHDMSAMFGAGVIIWAIWFLLHFEQLARLEKTRWGMDENKSAEFALHTYEPKLRGSWKQTFYSILGKVCTTAFLFVFIVVTFIIAMAIESQQLASAVQTGVIFIFSFTWGKVAKKIVDMENKRTQSRYNRSLTMRLAMVKLFIFLFPLLRLAFLAPMTDRVCEEDVPSVETFFYNKSAPALNKLGIYQNDPLFNDWLDLQRIHRWRPEGIVLTFLAEVHITPPVKLDGNGSCIRGCFPVDCELVQKEGVQTLVCETTCFFNLQRSLISLFVTHIAFTMIFIAVPMFQVRRLADKEIAKGDESPNHAAQTKTYTLLQYQEKCHDQARYEYASWGGSYVEDFLEVVLGFAVLCCFAIVCPQLAVVGFVSQVVEYRMLGYRMTWVTCRPFPAGSEGINEWFMVLEVIIYLAMVINALLAVDAMTTSLDSLPTKKKFIFVSGWSLSLVLIKVLMKVTMNEQPRSVVEAHDMNHEFVEKLHKSRRATTPSPRRSSFEQDLFPGLILGIGQD